MARNTMVVSRTRGRFGFTVCDASREWELAVFFVVQENGLVSFSVILTEARKASLPVKGTARNESVMESILRGVARVCSKWGEMEQEVIKKAVRSELLRYHSSCECVNEDLTKKLKDSLKSWVH